MRGLLSLLAGGLWITVVGFGLWRLTAYESTPGAADVSRPRWLCNTAILLDTKVPTLVMVVHPRCPCTRATLHELAQVLGTCQGRVRTHILFILPPGIKPGWEKTDLWKQAATLSGVTLHSDSNGQEAARFGAQTSGQCYLFAPDGRRLFAGGITASRGHEGDNAGTDALISLLTPHAGKTAIPLLSSAQTPVFGCPLISPQRSGSRCATPR